MGRQKADERDHRVGQRIAEARERAELTQDAIGDVFGVTKVQISKYEKGTDRISAIYLEAISRLTNTPITEFLAAIHESDTSDRPGLAEQPQAPFAEASTFDSLANVVASHINKHFSDHTRQELGIALAILTRELKRTRPKSNTRQRSVKRTGSANRVDRPE